MKSPASPYTMCEDESIAMQSGKASSDRRDEHVSTNRKKFALTVERRCEFGISSPDDCFSVAVGEDRTKSTARDVIGCDEIDQLGPTWCKAGFLLSSPLRASVQQSTEVGLDNKMRKKRSPRARCKCMLEILKFINYFYRHPTG